MRKPHLQAGPTALRAALSLILIVGALVAATGCGEEDDPRFDTPSATFKTHQEALTARNLELLWSCYSDSYKASTYGNDYAAWAREWQQKGEGQIEGDLRLEIADERVINERIGYLLFDASTLSSPQASPFSYLVREPDGWKMTTHLDSVFHGELERAIASGEFSLPTD